MLLMVIQFREANFKIIYRKESLCVLHIVYKIDKVVNKTKSNKRAPMQSVQKTFINTNHMKKMKHRG